MVQKNKWWVKPKIRKALALKICDYSLDMSKLVFAGIVLVTVMGYNTNKAIVLTFGVLATVLFALFGFYFYIVSKK